jgi:DNA-binding transcriptional MerR regulator
MSQGAYRMTDLMEATGMSRDMIRHYIQDKLIPGTVDTRLYGPETLQRLLEIRKAKESRIFIKDMHDVFNPPEDDE